MWVLNFLLTAQWCQQPVWCMNSLENSSHLGQKTCFCSFWELPALHFPTWCWYSEQQRCPSPGWQLTWTPWWLTPAVNPWLRYNIRRTQLFWLCSPRWLVKLIGSRLLLIIRLCQPFIFWTSCLSHPPLHGNAGTEITAQHKHSLLHEHTRSCLLSHCTRCVYGCVFMWLVVCLKNLNPKLPTYQQHEQPQGNVLSPSILSPSLSLGTSRNMAVSPPFEINLDRKHCLF